VTADWLAALTALHRQGQPAVLVTLLAARGSTPREPGCKMVVAAGTAHGTIGGGNLEFQSLRRARHLLQSALQGPVVAEFPLGPALGQCCGGHASVLFEPIRPPAWHIALYGAGHVGRALAAVLGTLECRLTWIDARPAEFPQILPDNVNVARDMPPAALPPGACMLVMTHDHALDFELVAEALPRADLPFVGLIGSETKRARFVSRLAKAGLAAEAIRRLVCPIGLAGTGGKAPAEIAVAVAAQLLQVRDAEARVADRPAAIAAAASCAACDAAGCAATGDMVR
jgi:xanthine dehydrogenase accessory factor